MAVARKGLRLDTRRALQEAREAHTRDGTARYLVKPIRFRDAYGKTQGVGLVLGSSNARCRSIAAHRGRHGL